MTTPAGASRPPGMPEVRFYVIVTDAENTPVFTGYIGKDETFYMERNGDVPAYVSLTARQMSGLLASDNAPSGHAGPDRVDQ